MKLVWIDYLGIAMWIIIIALGIWKLYELTEIFGTRIGNKLLKWTERISEKLPAKQSDESEGS